VQAEGSLEVSAGFKRDVTDNPTLPQRARIRNRFDLDQQIALILNAKVGDKLNFNLNYDSDAGADPDSRRKIGLSYRGGDDAIVQNIEAGNVRMTTTNTLIDGGAALFGFKADLQLGRLRINALLSQQQSETQTVSSRGSVQTVPFDFGADRYEQNRHFFLGYYFRNAYNRALSSLPYVQSPVSITRIEVWVTNRQGNYDRVRNLRAFADLGEHSVIHNPLWTPQGNDGELPHNRANSMYDQLADIQPDEKLENARLLSDSEYAVHPQLGYISLQMPLQDGEVLAVAYEYACNGKVYQTGQFAGDAEAGNALAVKLLKPSALTPRSPTWHLMMKNVYSVDAGAYNLQREHFKLQIAYQSDSTGIYLPYLPNSGMDETLLLQAMNLDRLDSRNNPRPDGVFDFVEGYTADSANGRIIFPVTEPFGSYLREKIGNDAIANRFVYQELYDSTLTVAKQAAGKNKFRMSGEYRGSSGAEINLNATNVPRGSVRVTAGGVTLSEGTDYSVDYLSGTLRILNRSILDAGTPLDVTLENRAAAMTQRKTLTGVNLLYDFSKNVSAGVTLMHYNEKPLSTKTVFGDEAAKNTLWGFNFDYRKQSVALTNLLDMLPFVEASAPSQLTAKLEFAHLVAGHYSNKYTGEYSYLDDFESSASGIDLRSAYGWSLASNPFAGADNEKNRALLAWFHIDGMFTQRNSGLTPAHIKNDVAQLSDHRVREVYEREIFPGREATFGQPSAIPVLNLSYYPAERGPYNLDSGVDAEGRLLNPRVRWGGIARRMDISDFESANIEYVEFWLMDPFANDSLGAARGGDLYLHLGEISEDIIKDGKKFFENGLPVDGQSSAVGYSAWGKYPLRQSTVYAFDNSGGDAARRLQDVGLNGLSSEEEKTFPAYKNYVDELQTRLSGESIARMKADAHSPLNDPAGDDFRHYRGEEQDRLRMSILDRYKYYNGTEGNSSSPLASRNTPDVEDLDNDNTLNETEAYYQYKISLRPDALTLGNNFIADKRETSVRLRNGRDGKVSWFLFRIPVGEYQSKTGNIEGFANVRFMRMFVTGCEEPLFLRFATLELKRSEWRNYQDASVSGSLNISAVNVEENGRRSPVNYVLPPGVSRVLDPGQPQLRQENEQSLSLTAKGLDAGEFRAVYKNGMYDLRRYKRLQMFVHAERLPDDPGNLQDGEMNIFLRIGSDYTNNYYEYEIPLRITPEGQYSPHSLSDRESVWPGENMFDFPLELLTNLKSARNEAALDPEKPRNRVSVAGNPSLAEVKVIMIGIRNGAENSRSAAIWVNELRLSEFDEQGGWAAQGNVQLALSDIGSVVFSGRKETAGFGALQQSLQQRRNDDYTSVQWSVNMELGRFFPKQMQLTAPLYYSYSNRTTSPLYDPFDRDVRLRGDSARNAAASGAKDVSLSLSNVRMNVKSKRAMPYDPANFSFTYARNENHRRSPDTEYATARNFRFLATYDYALPAKAGNNVRVISDVVRNYEEVKLRDINASGESHLSFGGNFFWNRELSFALELVRNLKTAFRSGTVAEIEEPYLQVNKALNRSDYEIWKDSVARSIRELGTPLSYAQTADATYTLPFASIPALDWIGVSAAYHSHYKWQRGATIDDQRTGNFLQNDLSLTLNGRLNPAWPMLRSVNVNVSYKSRSDIPGFDGMIGDFLGQRQTSGGTLPGWKFAFGFEGGERFVEKLKAGNLLVLNENNVTPAVYNETKNLRLDASLEPLPGLRIDLHALYEKNRRTDIHYIYEDMPAKLGGSFAMTALSLSSAFESAKAEDNYRSPSFDKFLANRLIIAERTRERYAGTTYPSGGFLAGSGYEGQPFSGDVPLNSADVLVPAFLSAYTGGNPNSAALTPFPGISALLPNWLVSYNMVKSLPLLEEYMQSLTLTHQYLSQYRVGSFESFMSWVPLGDGSDWGYIRSAVSGAPVPSTPFNISSASIQESFNPLIEARGVWNNNLSISFRINKSRALNLNIASYQIVETNDRDIVAGLGYRIPNFNRIVGLKANAAASGALDVRFDISGKTTRALIRKIEERFTQATSGIRSTTVSFSADYSLSRKITLRAFFDRVAYRPLVSSGSYPTSTTSAGISLRLDMDR
jgi:cell surface protein SprA